MANENEFVTLGELGNAMKAKANQTPGRTIVVSKKLWNEIAEVLMQINRHLDDMERLLKGEEDGK